MGCDPKPKRSKLSIPPNSSTIYWKDIDQRFRIFLFLVGSIRSMAWGSRPLYKLGVSYFPPSIEIHKPCLSTSWRRRAWPSIGSYIAIRPSPINHRVWIQTSPPCRFWVPKSHLQTSNSNTQIPKTSKEMKIKSTPYIKERESERKRGTYESISLGFARGLIGDDDSLEDLTKLLEVPPHLFCRGLPSQPTNEDFCKSCVSELWSIVLASHV